MAFDQATRNRLARFVSEARAELTEEFTRQLQLEYGLDPASGACVELDRLTQLDDARRATAVVLRETLDHYLAASAGRGAKAAQEALDRIVREQAFTLLNRLCALRMAEARGIIIESVAQGYQSKGFQLYGRLAGTALGETGDAYRAYLLSLFDELAVDLPALFERFAPEGRLFPRESSLLTLLGMLNHPDLAELWAADETIGWVYQYFNSQEERRQMRAESQAPRNSRELAVRNQFFTPRYVVEFLADNTLGRTWYEMTKGQTGLVDSCRYLVRRPNEVFLEPGERAPEADGSAGAGSELAPPVDTDQAAQAAFASEAESFTTTAIPHRPLKDPRAILMLDPACGSMHFGLYAFDLFERIYAEAWELEAERGPAALERAPMDAPLLEAYPDKDAFLRDVPRLIVERNIHGVDIDPRAAQIAALALWLRAQRSWREQGVKAQDRPVITRSNVVCAEPMPGDPAMLDEFIARHLAGTPEDRVVGQMLRRVFKAMELAGEAGSLLKIEEEIRAIIAEGKKQSRQGPRYDQTSLFGDTPRPRQGTLDLDASGITDEGFWQEAEGRIYKALDAYAGFAEDGNIRCYRRRLFADDARQGFAFIDLCRRHYDVVLMNPPFGAASAGWKATFERAYPRTKNDLYAAFVERGVAVLRQQGMLGAITSRTGFFTKYFQDWREKVVLDQAPPTVFADLGDGVLDAALVETAAYCLKKERACQTTFFRLLSANDKAAALSSILLGNLQNGIMAFEVDINSFSDIQGSPFSYWISKKIRSSFKSLQPLKFDGRDVRSGGSTKDDFRFLRVWWEVCLSTSARSRPETLAEGRWVPYEKGGSFSRFYRDWELTIDWKRDGAALKEFITEYRGSRGWGYDWSADIKGHSFYFQCGLAYPRRTTSSLNVRILQEGCVFADKGPAIFTNVNERRKTLSLLNSKAFEYFVSMQLGAATAAARSYEVGLVQRTPVPELRNYEGNRLDELAIASVSLKRDIDRANEISHIFHLPALLQAGGDALVARANARAQRIAETDAQLAAHQREIDDIAFGLYGIEGEDRRAIEEGLGAQGVAEAAEEADARPAAGSRGLTVQSRPTPATSGRAGGLGETEPAGSPAGRPQGGDDDEGDGETESSTDAPSLVAALISYLVGTPLGRWDIRYATGEQPVPELPDPFAPLPVCSPGMLQNERGLPATCNEEVVVSGQWSVVSEGNEKLTTDHRPLATYPLRISWPGILVDDEGHAEDIVGRAREAIRVIWGARADGIEQEACEILGVRSLRDYFARPASFFADHLARYSKSRRQAPIYWPLSTPSGSYTLWLYYHRLSDQTLYSCVNDFVEPKLRAVGDQLSALSQKAGRSAKEEKELEQLSGLRQELVGLREELLRVAAFWKPNLNDGVQITAAPLWRLFQHKPWQKRLKETWEKLEQGEYDWAHLAYSIWPERVREKCRADKSLAIAHDLEALYVAPPASAGKKGRGRGKRMAADEEELFEGQ